jgi:pentatricopeptide repeat protein
MDTSPKTVREHIARSKFCTQRQDILRSLKELATALDLLAASQIFGRERIDIGILMEEAVRLLMEQDMMKRSVPGGLSYVKGKEKELSAMLKRLAAVLEGVLAKRRVEERRRALLELDELMIAAQAELGKKEPLEARKLFRKAMEQFGEEQGLLIDIGTRLLLAGLPAEATEYFQKGMEAEPNDPRSYNMLIQCLEAMGDLDKAEDLMKATLRRFGPNEGLLVRVGRGALARRNWDEALNAVAVALKINPNNQEAHKIASEASTRVYGSPTGYLSTDSKPASKAPSKEIKIDI